MLRTNIGDLSDGINGAGIHRAGAGHNTEGPVPVRNIRSQRGIKRLGVHLPRTRLRYGSQVVAADAQQLRRLLVAAVPFPTLVNQKTEWRFLQPARTYVEATPHVTRHSHGCNRSHRCAAEQQAHAPGRKSHQVLEPAQHLPLHIDRSMVAAGATGVHRRGQGLGKDCDHVGGELTHP